MAEWIWFKTSGNTWRVVRSPASTALEDAEARSDRLAMRQEPGVVYYGSEMRGEVVFGDPNNLGFIGS